MTDRLRCPTFPGPLAALVQLRRNRALLASVLPVPERPESAAPMACRWRLAEDHGMSPSDAPDSPDSPERGRRHRPEEAWPGPPEPVDLRTFQAQAGEDIAAEGRGGQVRRSRPSLRER
jgi:hypothetical protein